MRRPRASLLLILGMSSILALGGCLFSPNVPPTAEFTVQRTGPQAPCTIYLDASPSRDPDGIIAGYRWRFADGFEAVGPTAEHTFVTAGTFDVRLIVRDDDGAEAVASVSVAVAQPNRPPIASVLASSTWAEPGDEIHFDASHSEDPDGTIASYQWTLGDGAVADGPTVEHVFSEPGVYRVTVTVIDDAGAASEAAIDVAIRQDNAPPVPAFSVSPAGPDCGESVHFDATSSYDPDGTIDRYGWQFGDGTGAQGGTAAHRYQAPGTYSITLTVTDDQGAQRSTTRSLAIGTLERGEEEDVLTRGYSWVYAGVNRSLQISIPASLYDDYRSQPRDVYPYRDYDEYVLDPLDDGIMRQIAQALSLGDYYATVENALAFVQKCVIYKPDPGVFEYPRYPVETLVDEVGDCEDSAILYASLIRTLGHGALLVSVDTDHNGNADHMVVFVPVDETYCDSFECGTRSFWEYDGQLYALAETAVEGGYMALGADPWGLTPGDIEQAWDVAHIDLDPNMTKRLSPGRSAP